MSEAAGRSRGGGSRSSAGRAALAIAVVLSFSLVGNAEGKGYSTKRKGKYKKRTPSFPSTAYKKGARAPAGGKAQKTEKEAAAGGEQEGGGNKRNKRGRRRRQMTDNDFPLRAGVVLLADLVGLCGGGCAWCLYLERKPSYNELRVWFYCMTGFVWAVELGLCYFETAWFWVVLAVAPVNTWGFLDAALRFPAPHGFDSFFAAKQICLLILKVLIYTMGLRDIYNTSLIYLSLIVFHIILIPLLYLAAQSEVDMQVNSKTSSKSPKQTLAEAGVEVCDVDILVRMWCILWNREQRHAFLFSCSRKTHFAALGMLQYLPVPLQDALAGVSPWAQRALREGKGRRV